jgi:6-phosphogluconolactonase (cycloisomerase 2 family)
MNHPYTALRSITAHRSIVPRSLVLLLAATLGACGGGDSSGSSSGGTPPPSSFTVGGTVSGLTGSGLVLQVNGGSNLAVAAKATSFAFSAALGGGTAYTVSVLTQPSNPAQSCTVSGASGTVGSSNVTSVSVVCTTFDFTVGGSISGLTSSGLVLHDNGGDALTVPANAKSFVFTTSIASGAAYAVSVATQPSNPAETCTVTSGSGSVGTDNVTTVSIACSAGGGTGTTKYTVGGTVSGLTSTGLILTDNLGDHLPVTAGATSFTLPTSFAGGSAYTVSVSTQPSNPAQVCTVANGSGTVGSANVATVAITCAAPTYKIGGSISGLTSGGLVLQDNAGDNLTVPANATTFTFATGLKTGAAYAATILTQPSAPAEVCTVTNGTGTVASAPITSITVKCARVGQFVLVANSTGGASNNGDVSVFSINSTTGVLTAVAGSPFLLGAGDSDPSGIAVDQNGHAYVTNTGSSDVSFFDIGSNGVLSYQSDFSTSGTVGISIAASANGYLYTAGSSTASTTSGSVSGFTIASSTGALTVTPNVPYSAGNPLIGIAIDPAAQLVFTTQASHDFITAYVINSDGSLTGANGDPLSTGLGGNPYGVVTSPLGTSAGGFVYVANPAAGSVSGYSYVTANAPPTASGNLLTPVPGGTQGSPGVFLTEGSGPEGIAIDPTGTYLYVANYQDGNVSSFSIDPQSGTLTLIGLPVATGNLTGATPTPGPIAVQVDPSGKFVYVVNQQDSSVSVFTSVAGTLTLLATYPCDSGATAVAIE